MHGLFAGCIGGGLRACSLPVVDSWGGWGGSLFRMSHGSVFLFGWSFGFRHFSAGPPMGCALLRNGVSEVACSGLG